jgi:hypothetical protein
VGIEVCKNCGKVHPSLFTKIEENFMTVAIVFSALALVITTLCGWSNYYDNHPSRNCSYRDFPKKNTNIWHLIRFLYKDREGGLTGLWFAYATFNFTCTVFLLAMFPLTIILPLVLGTFKTVGLCMLFYYGLSIWAMVAISIIGWYLYLVGNTLSMFKPYKEEKK